MCTGKKLYAVSEGDGRGFVLIGSFREAANQDQGIESPAASQSDGEGLNKLPNLAENDTDVEEALDAFPDARNICFLPSCPWQLKEFEAGEETRLCPHVDKCLKASCYPDERVAAPLVVKQSVLNQMAIDADLKHEIWLGARRNGPLVQRVSATDMVVKCRQWDKHPVGFLHVLFDCGALEPKMMCSCMTPESASMAPCAHYYYCMAVFASEEKLSKEFAYFLAHQHEHLLASGSSMNHVITVLGQDENGEMIEVQVLDEEGFDILTGDEALASASADFLLRNASSEDVSGLAERESLDELQEGVAAKRRKTRKAAPMTQHPTSVAENQVHVSFLDWLSGVTERINQTMHAQFPGKPAPLVFQVPHKFFECLRERMSASEGKMRLPNEATTICRRDAPPLGTFNRFTWKFYKLVHVRQIFDTPSVQIQMLRTFVDRGDGVLELVLEPDQALKHDKPRQRKKQKTSVLRTFLKVGSMAELGHEPCPFIIEWIPDILPVAKIGELRLSFQYDTV
jgi:hypothetical protein